MTVLFDFLTHYNFSAIMKSILVAALALACVLGLATANYGYYPSTGGSGLGGQSGMLTYLRIYYWIENSFIKSFLV
jgi:hypothetical protein